MNEKNKKEYPKIDPTKQFLTAFGLLRGNNDDPNFFNKINNIMNILITVKKVNAETVARYQEFQKIGQDKTEANKFLDYIMAELQK